METEPTQARACAREGSGETNSLDALAPRLRPFVGRAFTRSEAGFTREELMALNQARFIHTTRKGYVLNARCIKWLAES